MTNTLAAEFSHRLKAIRHIRQVTQKELSRRSGISEAQIGHFEIGTRLPNCQNLCRLADALEITTDYLLGRVEMNHLPHIDVSMEISQYRQLLLRTRQLLLAVTKTIIDQENP